MAALCVECDAELNLSDRARIGQRVVCPNCGVELEVISARPLEVDIAYDDGDEWNDMEGYSLDDELEGDDVDEYGRMDGVADIDFEYELEDELEDEVDDEEWDDFEDELEDDLDDIRPPKRR